MKIRQTIPVIVSCFFVLLFTYASFSKILDFEMFQIQLGQSPVVSAYAGWVSYIVIGAELFISLLLLTDATRTAGLYAATGLMTAFTAYIYLIINYSDFVPCSCGGVIEKLTWNQHMVFNLVFLAAGIFAVIIEERKNRKPSGKILIYISAFNAIAMVTVWILFQRSEFIIKKDNNFVRRYLPHAITEEAKKELESTAFVFAGADADGVYLYDANNPFAYVRINKALTESSKINVTLPQNKDLYKNTKLVMENEKFFFADGTVPVIYEGQNGYFHPVVKNQFYFDQLAVSNRREFVFRTISAKSKMHNLGIYYKGKVKLFEHILKKQKDGVFDTDGTLLHDPVTDNFLYLYKYRNQFLKIHNDFDKVEYQNTIDDTSTADVESRKTSAGEYKMAAPVTVVNKTGYYYSGLLFNRSNLIGKYEEKKLWERSAVIDVYNVDKGSYIGSFYLPVERKNINLVLYAKDQYLYVITENKLRKYRFAQNILTHFSKVEAEKP